MNTIIPTPGTLAKSIGRASSTRRVSTKAASSLFLTASPLVRLAVDLKGSSSLNHTCSTSAALRCSPLSRRSMASGVPKRMKGISIPKTGGVEVLEYRDDLPTPEPKEGEMLVKNDFVGVNYIDTYVLHNPNRRPCGDHDWQLRKQNLLFLYLFIRYSGMTLTNLQVLPHRPLPGPIFSLHSRP